MDLWQSICLSISLSIYMKYANYIYIWNMQIRPGCSKGSQPDRRLLACKWRHRQRQGTGAGALEPERTPTGMVGPAHSGWAQAWREEGGPASQEPGPSQLLQKQRTSLPAPVGPCFRLLWKLRGSLAACTVVLTGSHRSSWQPTACAILWWATSIYTREVNKMKHILLIFSYNTKNAHK